MKISNVLVFLLDPTTAVVPVFFKRSPGRTKKILTIPVHHRSIVDNFALKTGKNHESPNHDLCIGRILKTDVIILPLDKTCSVIVLVQAVSQHRTYGTSNFPFNIYTYNVTNQKFILL